MCGDFYPVFILKSSLCAKLSYNHIIRTIFKEQYSLKNVIMKKIFYTIVILTITVLLFSCNKNEDLLGSTELRGVWVWENANDTTRDYDNRTYKRVRKLEDNENGIILKRNNRFKERKTVPVCGMPPMPPPSYYDTHGNWEKIDSIIYIRTTDEFSGSVESNWQILSLDNERLKIHIVKEITFSDK